MNTPSAETEPFVVFPLAGKRFALPAAEVVELSRPGTVQKFPHTTPAMRGVLLHRGEILPIWDLALTLVGNSTPARKYYLVIRRNFAGEEWTAVPVSGECQMLHAEMLPPPETSPAHVCGLLFPDGQRVEVLDLGRLGTPGRPTLSLDLVREEEGREG
jgi:chemotaxis signal transduction protein